MLDLVQNWSLFVNLRMRNRIHEDKTESCFFPVEPLSSNKICEVFYDN